jgi:hypothetical protein
MGSVNVLFLFNISDTLPLDPIYFSKSLFVSPNSEVLSIIAAIGSGLSIL